MAECTDAEWVDDMATGGCWCPFKRCQENVRLGVLGASTQVVMSNMSPNDQRQAIEANIRIADMAYQGCENALRACLGRPELPVNAARFLPDENKTEARKAQSAFEDVGFVGMAVGLVIGAAVPQARAAAFSLGVAGLCLQVVASRLDRIKDDPPDSDFLTISQPPSIQLPAVIDPGLDALALVRLNGLLENQASSASFAIAVSTAVDKAQGAHLAGDNVSVERQLAAARNFAQQWGAVLSAAETTREAVIDSLANMHGPNLSLTLSQVLEFREVVLASGWPQEFRESIVALGMTSDEQQAAFERLATGLLGIGSMQESVIEHLHAPVRLRDAENQIAGLLAQLEVQ